MTIKVAGYKVVVVRSYVRRVGKITQQQIEEGTGDGTAVVRQQTNMKKSLTIGTGVGAEQLGRSSSMKSHSKRANDKKQRKTMFACKDIRSYFRTKILKTTVNCEKSCIKSRK